MFQYPLVKNSKVSSTAANINDHIACRLLNINTDTKGSGHGFVNEVDFFGTRLLGAVTDCSFFYFSNG